MSWIDQVNWEGMELLPPASDEDIRRVEGSLGIKLPKEFHDFLRFADGGYVHGRRFNVYSAGARIHPEETLLRANSRRGEAYPLIAVGRDASEDFGFRKEDLPCDSCPLYFIFDETFELTKVAASFRDFIEKLSRLAPGESFVVDHKVR